MRERAAFVDMARGREERRRLHTEGKPGALYARIAASGIDCPSPTAAAALDGMELLLIDPDGNALLFI